MNRLLSSLSLASLALAGCGFDSEAVLVPGDVELQWDDAFNGRDDGLGAIVPVDLMVYDRVTGEPLDGVLLHVESFDDQAVVLDGSDLTPVEPEDCVDCNLLWDAFRDQYFEVGDGAADVMGDLAVLSDVDGLARVYVVIDAFPSQGFDYGSITVGVATELSEDSFDIIAR